MRAVAPSVPARSHGQGGPSSFLSRWRVPWSPVAASRALAAGLVIPGLLALTSQVVGDVQMTVFATFGGFGTIVIAGFGGSRGEKLRAHAALAVAGSVLLVVGTAVRQVPDAAALLSIPIAFVVLFAGAAGSNAAIGATAALVAYVLPAASPGAVGMIPSRLAGWWLASVAGTIASVLLAPRPATDRLRNAAAGSAESLAAVLDSVVAGRPPAAGSGSRAVSGAGSEAVSGAGSEAGAIAGAIESGEALRVAFTSAPYRPSGLSERDRAIGRLVEALEWCLTIVTDAAAEEGRPRDAPAAERRRLEAEARSLRAIASELRGTGSGVTEGDLEELARQARHEWDDPPHGVTEERVHVAYHAHLLARAVSSAALEASIVAGGSRTGAGKASAPPDHAPRRPAPLRARASSVARVARVAVGQASLRSVWVTNSARGAFAVAAAVAIADVTSVQHGFWVVLGAMSVLRTSAAATGATAWRAVLGTGVGFVVGGALVLGIGVGTAALWVAFVVGVLIAAYTPGTAPFAVGQAAFTVLLTVLYNILAPVGWTVGALRVEDVAIGAGVSALGGALFLPRGAIAVVGEDLADAFHRGGVYLVQCTAWVLGLRATAPDRTPALQASDRLDDAVRALLTEQGAKHVTKEDLWRLVGGTLRVRLTAESLGVASPAEAPPDPTRALLLEDAVLVAGRCDGLAATLGHAEVTVARELAGLALPHRADDGAGPCARWVRQHLDHLERDLAAMERPAAAVARARRRSWWR